MRIQSITALINFKLPTQLCIGHGLSYLEQAKKKNARKIN